MFVRFQIVPIRRASLVHAGVLDVVDSRPPTYCIT